MVSNQQQGSETDTVTLYNSQPSFSLPAQGVAVATNNHVIPRTEWADCLYSEGISHHRNNKAACGG